MKKAPNRAVGASTIDGAKMTDDGCCCDTKGQEVRMMNGSRAQDYLSMAESYGEGVRKLANQGQPPHAPFNMLLAHALELSFKAVLLCAGRDEEWVMMMGHDLHSCHRAACSKGFVSHAPTEIATLVGILDGPHRDLSLRYPGLQRSQPDLPASEVAMTLWLHLQDVRAFVCKP